MTAPAPAQPRRVVNIPSTVLLEHQRQQSLNEAPTSQTSGGGASSGASGSAGEQDRIFRGLANVVLSGWIILFSFRFGSLLGRGDHKFVSLSYFLSLLSLYAGDLHPYVDRYQ